MSRYLTSNLNKKFPYLSIITQGYGSRQQQIAFRLHPGYDRMIAPSPRALEMPAGGNFRFIEANDGTKLRTAFWPALTNQQTPPAHGSVVLLQGRREFIEKYYETINDLRDRGFAVYTLDWRGQGLSQRPLANAQKGYVENFDQYLSDLKLFMETQVLPHAPRPLYLVGHSMGGHCALRFLHDHPGVFDKAVLSAPMVEIELGVLTGLSKAIVKSMMSLGRGQEYALFQNDFSEKGREKEIDLLSSDPVRLQIEVINYRQNPDLRLGGVTYGWLNAAFQSINTLSAPGYAEAIKTPILMAIGSADKVVSQKALINLAARLPHGRHQMIAGARHELLIERNELRNQFWTAFDRFIKP
jgi:lysophospholipase